MAAEKPRRLDGVGLAQELLQVLGLHLLEGVGGLVGAQRGQQLPALVAPQVLQQVGQLARAQAVQALVRRLEAHLRGRRRPTSGGLGEGLDGRPVDDAVRRGARPPPARPQPAQQGGVGHVGPDQPDAAEHLGQVEVGGPDDLDALDVDQLVVEDVLGQQHLAGTADHVAEVEPGRAQEHLGVADPVDGRGGHEGEAAPDPDDQAADGRVRLPVGPAGDDVVQPADLLAGLVGHRPAEDAGQRHDGVEDALGGQDAAGAAAALVRRALRRRADAPGEGVSGRSRSSTVAWPWSYLLCGACDGGQVGTGRTVGTRAAPAERVQRPAPPHADATFGAHGHARGADQTQLAGAGRGAPAVLLGGSPLAWPHLLLLCPVQGVCAERSSGASYRARRP